MNPPGLSSVRLQPSVIRDTLAARIRLDDLIVRPTIEKSQENTKQFIGL
jgi:hypothetical protein